ncbi:MAG: hypothetical protein Q9228_007941, partial [Teloschistes exilis]
MEELSRSAQVTISQSADDFRFVDLSKIDDGRPTARPNQRIARIDGQMVVYHENAWWPAVFHSDLRAEKIAEAPPEIYIVMASPQAKGLKVLGYSPKNASGCEFGQMAFQVRDTSRQPANTGEDQQISFPGSYIHSPIHPSGEDLNSGVHTQYQGHERSKHLVRSTGREGGK